MNWIEWKGEPVGSRWKTVCICVYSYVDEGEPVKAIIPRAYCTGANEYTRAGGEWTFFEGGSSSYNSLRRVPRKKRQDSRETEYINIYQPKRGDKIFYCVPTLPDGRAFSLNSVRKNLYKGLAVVGTGYELAQVDDLKVGSAK